MDMNIQWSEIWTPIPVSNLTADFLSLGCQLPAEVRILSLPLNVSLLEPVSLEVQIKDDGQTCLVPKKMRARGQGSDVEDNQSHSSQGRDKSRSGKSSYIFSNPVENPVKRPKTEDDFTQTNLSTSGINWVLHQDSEFKDDWELQYPPEDPTNYLTASHQIESPLLEQGLRKNCFPIILENHHHEYDFSDDVLSDDVLSENEFSGSYSSKSDFETWTESD
jgi:hypothetical protein